MREADKPFVCYRQGWAMKIVPRNAAGWRAFGLWMASLLPLIGLFVAGMALEPGPRTQIGIVAVFLAASGLWAFAMIRWMLARSEIVQIDELLQLKRERDERNKRR